MVHYITYIELFSLLQVIISIIMLYVTIKKEK